MPRIPERNPRFRTKDKLCRDIATILNVDLHYGTKFAVLSEATWVWTEFKGKYKGCEYWSKAALVFKRDTKKLVHDHAVPKNIIIRRLIQLPLPTTPDVVNLLLESICKGVVITRDEDALLTAHGLRSKMPTGWDDVDPWARYSSVGIQLHPISINPETY